AQVAEIFSRMAAAGGDVIATRASVEAYNAVHEILPEACYHEVARIIGLRQTGLKQTGASTHLGAIAVVCAGTSDLPVAEEAAVTAEYLGLSVSRVIDVGVAGLHRILAQREVL